MRANPYTNYHLHSVHVTSALALIRLQALNMFTLVVIVFKCLSQLSQQIFPQASGKTLLLTDDLSGHCLANNTVVLVVHFVGYYFFMLLVTQRNDEFSFNRHWQWDRDDTKPLTVFQFGLTFLQAFSPSVFTCTFRHLDDQKGSEERFTLDGQFLACTLAEWSNEWERKTDR